MEFVLWIRNVTIEHYGVGMECGQLSIMESEFDFSILELKCDFVAYGLECGQLNTNNPCNVKYARNYSGM